MTTLCAAAAAGEVAEFGGSIRATTPAPAPPPITAPATRPAMPIRSRPELRDGGRAPASRGTAGPPTGGSPPKGGRWPPGGTAPGYDGTPKTWPVGGRTCWCTCGDPHAAGCVGEGCCPAGWGSVACGTASCGAVGCGAACCGAVWCWEASRSSWMAGCPYGGCAGVIPSGVVRGSCPDESGYPCSVTAPVLPLLGRPAERSASHCRGEGCPGAGGQL